MSFYVEMALSEGGHSCMMRYVRRVDGCKRNASKGRDTSKVLFHETLNRRDIAVRGIESHNIVDGLVRDSYTGALSGHFSSSLKKRMVEFKYTFINDKVSSAPWGSCNSS